MPESSDDLVANQVELTRYPKRRKMIINRIEEFFMEFKIIITSDQENSSKCSTGEEKSNNPPYNSVKYKTWIWI